MLGVEIAPCGCVHEFVLVTAVLQVRVRTLQGPFQALQIDVITHTKPNVHINKPFQYKHPWFHVRRKAHQLYGTRDPASQFGKGAWKILALRTTLLINH